LTRSAPVHTLVYFPHMSGLFPIMHNQRAPASFVLADDRPEAAAARRAMNDPRGAAASDQSCDAIKSGYAEQVLALRQVLLDACRRALDPDLSHTMANRMHRGIVALSRSLRDTVVDFEHRQDRLSPANQDRAGTPATGACQAPAAAGGAAPLTSDAADDPRRRETLVARQPAASPVTPGKQQMRPADPEVPGGTGLHDARRFDDRRQDPMHQKPSAERAAAEARSLPPMPLIGGNDPMSSEVPGPKAPSNPLSDRVFTGDALARFTSRRLTAADDPLAVWAEAAAAEDEDAELSQALG
jgi:hypothetical protein